MRIKPRGGGEKEEKEIIRFYFGIQGHQKQSNYLYSNPGYNRWRHYLNETQGHDVNGTFTQ